MTTKLERKILTSIGAAVVFFLLSTLHLFHHASSPEHLNNGNGKQHNLRLRPSLFHIHGEGSSGGGGSNNGSNGSDARMVILPVPKKEAVLLLSKIPFPQSVANEEFETIRHPAVDMMMTHKDGEAEVGDEGVAEDGSEAKGENEKKILSVPHFWDPPHLFKDGVRTFLGNYGERLITPDEAAKIGSYVRPLDREDEEEDEEEEDEEEEDEEEEEEEEESEDKHNEQQKPPRNDNIDLLETIFVSIASYRDYRCPHTVSQIFQQATYPERIRVAIVDQIDPTTDVNCAKPPKPCADYPHDNNNDNSNSNSNDALCKYSHLIDVYEMDARLAVGPVLARHIGNRMYRGEYYAMQSDAHMEFRLGWDVDIIQQWKSAQNEMAVLSTYVSNVDGHYNTATGGNDSETRPKMCHTDFDTDYYDARLANLMHGQQPEGMPDIVGEPTLSPFWAAGFSFSRGHFVIQVPYDQYLPMIFQGEEINIGVRGFTYGYDYYSPERSVLFHYYSDGRKDKKVKSFYEHSDAYNGLEAASMARLLSITELIPKPTVESNVETGDTDTTVVRNDAIEWNHVDQKEYGLGHVRTVGKFLRTFGINIVTQTIEHHLCRFVGKPMNEMFLAHKKENGMGVDYDKISFEFKDPEEYGKTWEQENGDDCCEEEEEEEKEEEGQDQEQEEGEETVKEDDDDEQQ